MLLVQSVGLHCSESVAMRDKTSLPSQSYQSSSYLQTNSNTEIAHKQAHSIEYSYELAEQGVLTFRVRPNVLITKNHTSQQHPARKHHGFQVHLFSLLCFLQLIKVIKP